ncbi:MAG: type IV toxin-antitoxin system AbiEi family antitoxin domain-containing protein [Treponema sp.]|jgi:predicted transcriptional regulator of viral defense system|nr:type IV toxin-antitoxin system AbiEi family antitoxin domain-containing protein [Treponema sp.]
MKPVEEIRRMFESSGGMLRTKELYTRRVFYNDIRQFINDGLIEKIRYGYYQWIDENNPSEARLINQLFPDGILNMDTALFYYGYSDRTPLAWNLAVSKDSGKSRFKIDYPFVRPYFVEPALLDLGLSSGVIDGNPVRIYDKERTICDCLRYRNKMDREIFVKSIQRYVNDTSKNIPRLMLYAKKLRVTSVVKNLVGVWL